MQEAIYSSVSTGVLRRFFGLLLLASPLVYQMAKYRHTCGCDCVSPVRAFCHCVSMSLSLFLPFSLSLCVEATSFASLVKLIQMNV